MTTAQRIAIMLNHYDATHSVENRDIWNDVIGVLPEYDEEATAKADPEYRGNIVVLTGGVRIEHREGKWVAAEPPSNRAVNEVLEAQFVWKRAEVALHERIREAVAEGVSERDLADASGISLTKVRRVLGRV